METEKHYFRVGLFFVTAMAVFIYYLITFGGDTGHQRLVRHAIYFDRSIAGLEEGAPVKFNGISVGLISDIRFISRDSDRIRVLADISDTAPVRVDTVASVDFQGIAGTAYLSLQNIHPEQPPVYLTVVKGEDYPVIPSQPSEMQALLSDAPAVMGKITKVVDQTQKLLSDRNVATAEALLPEAHDMLTEAAGAFREIKMLARTVREDPSIILRGTKYNGYQVENK